MTAVTDSFDVTNPLNVPYTWTGEGTLEFAKKK